jgi:hypothetical protein
VEDDRPTGPLPVSPQRRRRERVVLNVAWAVFVGIIISLVIVVGMFLDVPERLKWLVLAIPLGLAVIVGLVGRMAWDKHSIPGRK